MTAHTGAVSTRLLTLTALVGLVAAVFVAGAPPAAAHPFGPPPTARISAQGRTVTIEWSATPDDAVAIGEVLKIMPPGSVAAYRQEGAAQVAPSGQDEARLSASPQLARYLTERIVVTQDGQPCEAEVPPPTDFVHSGATVVAACPEPVSEATLRITMLHDINDAYRTVGIGTRTVPAQSVFTLAAPEATWRFGVEPSSQSSSTVILAATALAVIAAAGAAVALRRRRRG